MDSSTLSTLQNLLPLLIPVVILQLILLLAALYDWFKQPTLRWSRWVWLPVIFISIVGPIIYFLAARKEE